MRSSPMRKSPPWEIFGLSGSGEPARWELLCKWRLGQKQSTASGGRSGSEETWRPCIALTVLLYFESPRHVDCSTARWGSTRSGTWTFTSLVASKA